MNRCPFCGHDLTNLKGGEDKVLEAIRETHPEVEEDEVNSQDHTMWCGCVVRNGEPVRMCDHHTRSITNDDF